MDDAQLTGLKTQWDLSPLLAGDDDPKIDALIDEVKKAYQNFVDKWEARTDYLNDPVVLKEALDEYEALARENDCSGSVGYYFWLRYQQEQTNPTVKAWNSKINDIETKVANSIEFFTNRLAKIPQEKQKIMLEAENLLTYKHFLEKLFESAKYLLSEPEEKILNLKSVTSFGNWKRMTKEFISKEERQIVGEDGKVTTKSFSELLDLVDCQNKQVRDDAAKALNEIFEKHVDVAEHEINSILRDKQIDDELRGLDRPDKLRHIGDDIDTEVVDALLDAISARNNLSHRFYSLKAKIMGVDKLAYHERNVPLGKLDHDYPYLKTVSVVKETFANLDYEFETIFTDMVTKGQVDVYPAKGKYSGAFCTHKRLKDPSYILLNHNNKLGDVTTLAHEMGHAINNTLIAKTQNALDNDTPLSTAEVASTFMEDFVFDRLSREYDDGEKLSLYMQKLGDDVSSIFRQVACYKFEQELHKSYREKNYLTKDDIGALFLKHMSGYMGDAVEQSSGSQNWWVYWSHIRSYFYVYSYASGQLISKALQNMVRRDKSEISKVKKFLSAGLSESPKKLFLDMGIDITDAGFWNKGLDQVEDLLNQAESLALQQQPSN